VDGPSEERSLRSFGGDFVARLGLDQDEIAALQ
jgi:hypothetical protein